MILPPLPFFNFRFMIWFVFGSFGVLSNLGATFGWRYWFESLEPRLPVLFFDARLILSARSLCGNGYLLCLYGSLEETIILPPLKSFD